MEQAYDLFQKLNFIREPEFREEILNNCKITSFAKGDVIVKEGQYVRFLPLVIQGAIRVYQQKDDREILLYYVRAKETCTMSLAAAYFENKSTSHGVVVEPAEVLIFPSYLIMQWQLKYPSWNKYVMEMFRKRYDELIGSFQNVVFEHVNVRMMEYLKKRSLDENCRRITISHQHLAYELGTTRVVVSRILKQFENEKKIKLFRGVIELQ
jgi:CRP/FNR family transcriptional regulator